MLRLLPCALASLVVLTSGALAQPLTTAFTYQGELRTAGSPASGAHDLRFSLYDAPSAGAQIGPTLCADNVTLVNGRFVVSLDFGPQFAGLQRFLEIEVRADTGLPCSNATGFVVLSPRQEITAAPVATHALTAGVADSAANATQLNGQGAGFYQNASNLTSGTLPSGLLSGAYAGALTFSNAGNSFTGSGAGLTGLDASSIDTGTLADARLSPNVALLDAANTFSAGQNVFSGALQVGGFQLGSSANPGEVLTADASGVGTWQPLTGGITLPYSGLGSIGNPNALFGVTNTGTGFGVMGQGPGAGGVLGMATGASGAGVYGFTSNATTSGSGVFGWTTAITGDTSGLFGQSDSDAGRGAVGWARAITGPTRGVWGQSDSTSGIGVYAWTPAASGETSALYARAESTEGRGVVGWAAATSGDTTGVWGQSNSPTGRGVYGLAPATSGTAWGVMGQSNSNTGRGVYGVTTATSGFNTGVYGLSPSTTGRGALGWATATTGANYGMHGQTESTAGTGVFGIASAFSGPTNGTYGQAESTQGRGAVGFAANGTGVTHGVWGQSNSVDGRGVFGWTPAATGTTFGVYGQANSTSGLAVYGLASATTGTTYGGRFENSSTGGRGVLGWAAATSGQTYGGFMQSSSTGGRGVFGFASAASGTTYGVSGQADSPSGWSLWAWGSMGASGVKAFRIDHPEDPANRYLLHYAPESPEVINFYRGTVTLDGAGAASIELPPYFARINKEATYQLTPVGVPMPMLHVQQEIDPAALALGAAAAPGEPVPVCVFRVAGGTPGGKVSWRVEAVRNDAWIRARGAPVELDKLGDEKGTYQHPDLYGLPAEMGVNFGAGVDRNAGPAQTSTVEISPSPVMRDPVMRELMGNGQEHPRAGLISAQTPRGPRG